MMQRLRAREIIMRALTLGVLATAIAFAVVPADAQTYAPGYPICMQVYGVAGNYISCRYASMDQCRLLASGRAAQCIVNPYFAGGPRKGRSYRRGPAY